MCDEANLFDQESVRERLRKVRALIQSARERVAALRPAWGAHLASETLLRLKQAVEELEREIGVPGAEEPGSQEGRTPGAVHAGHGPDLRDLPDAHPGGGGGTEVQRDADGPTLTVWREL